MVFLTDFIERLIQCVSVKLWSLTGVLLMRLGVIRLIVLEIAKINFYDVIQLKIIFALFYHY
jgi:hypothetical protein